MKLIGNDVGYRHSLIGLCNLWRYACFNRLSTERTYSKCPPEAGVRRFHFDLIYKFGTLQIPYCRYHNRSRILWPRLLLVGGICQGTGEEFTRLQTTIITNVTARPMVFSAFAARIGIEICNRCRYFLRDLVPLFEQLPRILVSENKCFWSLWRLYRLLKDR